MSYTILIKDNFPINTVVQIQWKEYPKCSTLDFNLIAEQKKKKLTREVKFMVFFCNFEVYSLEKWGTKLKSFKYNYILATSSFYYHACALRVLIIKSKGNWNLIHRNCVLYCIACALLNVNETDRNVSSLPMSRMKEHYTYILKKKSHFSQVILKKQKCHKIYC